MSKRKRYKPAKGEVIEINHRPVFSTQEGFNDVEAIVVEDLHIQFLCELQDGTHSLVYRFYQDQGDSWRFKE